MTKLSAVMPMATMAPAMPGRFSAKPTELPSSTMHGVGDDRRRRQRGDHHDAEAAVVEEAVTRRPGPGR